MPGLGDWINRMQQVNSGAYLGNLAGANLQHGQQVGSKVWDSETGRLIDPGNPGDPAQTGKWSAGVGDELGRQQMYDPATLARLQTMFSPLFNMQLGTYDQGFNSGLNRNISQATNAGGAIAAQQGYARPGAFLSSARSRLMNEMYPGYYLGRQNLMGQQLGSLLGATSQADQFRANNLQAQMGNLTGLTGMNNQRQMQESQQSGIGGYLLGGLGMAAGGVLGGVGNWAGDAIGSKVWDWIGGGGA